MSKLFNGSWRIDVDDPRSKVWDAAAGEYVKDSVGREEITIRVEDGVQHYDVRVGLDPTRHLSYSSKYDDPTWVPYTLVGIEGEDADAALARGLEIGKPLSMVRTILVDDRTHYRLGKSARDGSAEYVMLRRLAVDGQSYVSTLLNSDGVIRLVRVFRRA